MPQGSLSIWLGADEHDDAPVFFGMHLGEDPTGVFAFVADAGQLLATDDIEAFVAKGKAQGLAPGYFEYPAPLTEVKTRSYEVPES